MTDTAAIVTQAQALEGQGFTVYTHHARHGVVVDQGHMGYVTDDVHMTFSRDRTARGLPPEVARIMLKTVTGLHPVEDGDVPLRDLARGQTLGNGPLEGATVLGTDTDGELTWVQVQSPGQETQWLVGTSSTCLPID